MDMPDLTQPPVRAKGMVHAQIAKTAKGLAEEHWEILAKQNAFYARHKDPRKFVKRFWPNYVDMARQILVGMLGNPKYDKAFKDEILKAVTLDGTINPKDMALPAQKPAFALTKR